MPRSLTSYWLGIKLVTDVADSDAVRAHLHGEVMQALFMLQRRES
jgi:hypothetical protein